MNMAAFTQLLAVLTISTIAVECTRLYIHKRDLIGNAPLNPRPSRPAGENSPRDAYATHPPGRDQSSNNPLPPRPPLPSRPPPRRTTTPPKPRKTTPPPSTKPPSSEVNEAIVIAVSVVVTVVVVVIIIAVATVIICRRRQLNNVSGLRENSNNGQMQADGEKTTFGKPSEGNIYTRSSSDHYYATADNDSIYLELKEDNSLVTNNKTTPEVKRSGPLPAPPTSAELPSDYIEFTSEDQASPPPGGNDVYTYVEPQTTQMTGDTNDAKRNSSTASYYG